MTENTTKLLKLTTIKIKWKFKFKILKQKYKNKNWLEIFFSLTWYTKMEVKINKKVYKNRKKLLKMTT